MSDVRRVDVWDGKYLPEIGDGSFVADDPGGSHALVPWDEIERLRAHSFGLQAQVETLEDATRERPPKWRE